MAKILLADDDAANRDILRTRLERAGYAVVEAADGEACLAAAAAAAPDLVLLDVMMPRLDGWQVCRRLKGAEDTRHIPVLMLTALGRDVDELRGWESGADGYLAKPCGWAELEGALARWLPAPAGGPA